MKTATAKFTTFALCAWMVLVGGGVSRLIVAGWPDAVHRLVAAAGQLLGLAGLGLVACALESTIQRGRRSGANRASGESHPLAS